MSDVFTARKRRECRRPRVEDRGRRPGGASDLGSGMCTRGLRQLPLRMNHGEKVGVHLDVQFGFWRLDFDIARRAASPCSKGSCAETTSMPCSRISACARSASARTAKSFHACTGCRCNDSSFTSAAPPGAAETICNSLSPRRTRACARARRSPHRISSGHLIQKELWS